GALLWCIVETVALSVSSDTCGRCSLVSAWAGFFFFFQAEDGIRDSSVTGVQTCALPISIPLRLRSLFRWARADQELDDELREHQIGRASCRERVDRSVAAVSGKKKQQMRNGQGETKQTLGETDGRSEREIA